MYHRWQKRNTSPSSSTQTTGHINNRWLTTPERRQKTIKLRQCVKSAEVAVRYLRGKIVASTQRLGVDVDDSMHIRLENVMAEKTNAIHKKVPFTAYSGMSN